MNSESKEILWRTLSGIRALRYEVTSGEDSKTGWEGWAEGSVEVSVKELEISFEEECIYHPSSGKPLKMKNIFLWKDSKSGVTLYHGRRGPAVHLADLRIASENRWISDDPHRCGNDVYDVSLSIESDYLGMVWKIDGPKKKETITYTYR